MSVKLHVTHTYYTYRYHCQFTMQYKFYLKDGILVIGVKSTVHFFLSFST